MESMSEGKAKLFKELMRKAVDWRKSYEGHIRVKWNDWILEDYMDEMATHLYPYLRAMVKGEQITEREARVLSAFYAEQVVYLGELIYKVENPEGDPVALWHG